MNTLAVLITCHNRKEKTLKCLKSLILQKLPTDINFDVFIVDDGSNDGTTEAINFSFPNCRIIRGDGNLFWNQGMILAWQHASKFDYDYYLWLNDDTYLLDNAISCLIMGSRLRQNMSIIIGTTKSEYSDKVTYGGYVRDGVIIEPNGELTIAKHFNGNIILVPKYVFKKVGFLDSCFHHAIGDYDYGLRAKILGIDSYVANDICGFCEQHTELPFWCNPKNIFLERFQNLYRTSCGTNPIQYFIFERRHKGLITATFHFLTINMRVLFPKLWKNTLTMLFFLSIL